MAFSTNGNGTRGRGRFQHSGALSEINVTPFVDVLLVLLIIFMLTAHVMESGIDVDVPAVKTTKDTTKDLPIVVISKDSEFSLGDKPINRSATARLRRFMFAPTSGYPGKSSPRCSRSWGQRKLASAQ